jgi:hypothetical protein
MLPLTRLATSWGGLARSIQLLCLLPLAASLTLPSGGLYRQCDFASSSRYSVHPDAYPSGAGKLWEYYHFLIDFAPDILYEMRDDRAPCKWLQVPGWHGTTFELTLPGQPQRSMDAHFGFLLGQPLNLTMAVVGNQQTFEETAWSTSTPTRMLQWNCHSAAEWVGFPAEYYTGFRDYARALPGVPPAQRRDIVAVKRLYLQNYSGPPFTGCSRRCLDDSFYDSLLEDSQSHGYNTAVLALEGQSVADQISIFSDVKVVLAQHGAALSNIIFARPGTLVVEIGHRDFPCYTRLSEKLGLPYLHYESQDYSDEMAQAVHEEMVTQVQEVIQRFVMVDGRSQGAPVRCPSFATCVGQQFA